jgi:phenylalanyl-tRNA synthetase alpha chain
VPLADNYELLGYAPDAAARDARYTRYVSGSEVLRTHTSAMIPGLLRSLACAACEDVLLAYPGLVYRRDRIDRLSVASLISSTFGGSAAADSAATTSGRWLQ